MSNGEVAALAYTPTNWQDGVTPLNAANFNKIEAELASLEAAKVPPVVNGQWIKGVGGAMVWSAIAAGDIPDLSASYVARPAGLVAGEGVIYDGSAMQRWDSRQRITQAISAANTDVAWPAGRSDHVDFNVTTGGGTWRRLGGPTQDVGTRVVIRNGSGSSITILNNAAAGTGAVFINNPGSDLVLPSGDVAEYDYIDGFWIQVGKLAAAAAAGASLVTSLPGSPTDGQECVLTDSLTAPTYQWHLQYVAAKASNKWVCVGSTPLFAENAVGDTTASATYIALGAGPSLTVPLAGDYFVTASALISNSTGASGNASGFMGYDVGATAAADADAAVGYIGGSVNIYSVATRVARKTGLAASTVLASKYKVTGTNTMLVQARRLLLEPIAVGG